MNYVAMCLCVCQLSRFQEAIHTKVEHLIFATNVLVLPSHNINMPAVN